MNIDQVKNKLKKLFAVAECDASADGEVANAMAAASALMNAHQVTREDLTDNDDGTVNIDDLKFGKHTRYSRYSAITAWESALCRFIVEFVPGTGYYVEKNCIRKNQHGMATNKRATIITFYGPDLDAQFCCEIFDEVVYFIAAAASLRYGNAMARGQAAAYAEGFAHGLLDANREEVKQLKQVAQSDSTALVVVNRSLAVSKASRGWIETELGGRLRKGRGARSAAHKGVGAYNQGKVDGAGYKPGSTRKAGYLE